MSDLISRQAAIDALWKALYEYEDKTEKQFQESEDLDVGDWMLHRIFVQNMSGIDIQTILNLPSAEPVRYGKWIYGEHDIAMCDGYRCSNCGYFVPWDYSHKSIDYIEEYKYCPQCGARMDAE